MNNTTFTPTADVLAIGTYYIATNYGIHPDNAATANTSNCQKLVDQVSANGGGTIFFPVGTYCFGIKEEDFPNLSNAVHPYALSMPSNVSIVGENTENTIFKLIDINEEVTLKVNGEETAVTQHYPYTLFYFMGDKDHPITGCSYTNFTVDAFATDKKWVKEPKESEESDNYVKGNMYYAKAFYYQYVKNCVFRDLILKGTLGTALGIDYLDNVQIENVNCYQCGRNFYDDTTATGSSGIGIGTGGWENENFYIHNCTCVESGQFGIFIENQMYLGWGAQNNPDGSYLVRGCIISNCIARNGRNKGIGIRGGRDVIVTGCEAYENESDGIYIDGRCQNIKIDGCISSFNKASGIYVKPSKKGENAPKDVSETSYRITVSDSTFEGNYFDGINAAPVSTLSTLVLKDNVLLSNQLKGIRLANGFTAPVLMGNYISHDGPGLSIDAATYPDSVVKDNVIRTTVENGGNFTGFTDENELLKGRGTVIRISYSSFLKGVKIQPDGTTETESNTMTTEFVDISEFEGNTFSVIFNKDIGSIRIAQYSDNYVSLHTLLPADSDGKYKFPMEALWHTKESTKICNHAVTVSKLTSVKYIRIFVDYKNMTMDTDFELNICEQ